jgi:hypothetical protein
MAPMIATIMLDRLKAVIPSVPKLSNKAAHDSSDDT